MLGGGGGGAGFLSSLKYTPSVIVYTWVLERVNHRRCVRTDHARLSLISIHTYTYVYVYICMYSN